MTEIVVDFQYYYIKCIKIFNLICLVFKKHSNDLSRRDYLRIYIADALYLLLALNASIFFGLSTHLLYSGDNDVRTLVFAICSTLSVIRYMLRFIMIFQKKMEIADVMDVMKKSYQQTQVDAFEISGYTKYFKMMRNMILFNSVFVMFFLNFGPLIGLIFYGEMNFPLNSPFENGQCFFGQMLKDASESVVNGIYECGWEDINDIQIRRAFISIIQRSQKPECLTIMKFGDVTLKQFTTASDEQIYPKEYSNKIIFT
ncbi:unnamed protein product [Chironomus riparius]|uniref:Odorant receptor n=1 Tax=Chironomus riparius TaxID=315576 RepID=A0A9N9RQ98_9DIPT|nr:unnamed protein product [Chironomus riparius]